MLGSKGQAESTRTCFKANVLEDQCVKLHLQMIFLCAKQYLNKDRILRTGEGPSLHIAAILARELPFLGTLQS